MAKSEEFNLEQVLQHTRRREEEKQRELHLLADEERRLRDQLATLREKEEIELRALAERRGVIAPAEIDAALSYLSAIEGSITSQLDIVAEVEARVLEHRERLVAILQEKQSLERLKQRHQEEAAAERNRIETKTADDITSARFTRRANEA